jgi:hypothetical protein
MDSWKYYEDWTIVLVKWRDAHASTDPWVRIDNYVAEDCIIHTVGYLWKDCVDGYITVAGSIDVQQETVGDVNHVPLGMILEVKRLGDNNA